MQNPASGLNAGLSSFLATQSAASQRPKASLNWLLFDEQFKVVLQNNNSSFDAITVAANTTQIHTKNNLLVGKSGYLYVYVSNEGDNVDVFFDNLQVTHTRSPLLEETHYYPFGLTMAGISSEAAGSIQNKFKFNGGNELQSQEFSDGSGLETYDARHRMFDPQIGKFLQIDPLDGITRELSPYAFSNNNPISLNDPLGLSATTPGVNSDDPNKDAARMQDVTVTGHSKNSPNRVGWGSVGHTRGFHFPTYTRQDRKTWDNAQALYNSRIAKNQKSLQGSSDESEYYRNNQKRLQTLYQADEDHKKMSIGAVLVLASPVLVMAAPNVIAATQPYAIAATQRYGGKFALNWFKQFAANNGDVSKIDYFDVTLSTISPFGSGIGGKLGTDIINSTIDFKNGELTYIGGGKTKEAVFLDAVFNVLRTGAKTSLGTGEAQNLLIDVHGGQAKSMIKEIFEIK